MSRPKTWTCRRRWSGVPCLHVNTPRKRKCALCGGAKPSKRRPKHMAALDLPYEEYVALNGTEECGICGARRKPDGRRLHRDHDHRTGEPRGLLCFRCNAALRPYMTSAWLVAAADYVARRGAAF